MLVLRTMEHTHPDIYPPEEVTQVGAGRARRHRNLLRCVLLLHSHATWSSEQAELWRMAVGEEVSARALVLAIQRAGI